MDNFWTGFVKCAEEDKKRLISPLAAGAAATGTGAAIESGYNIYKDRSENRSVGRSRSLKDLQKKLNPGDIVFSRSKLKDSPMLAGGKVPLRTTELIQGITGSPHYHSGIYRGRGRVSQMVGGVGYKGESSAFKDAFLGEEIKVYRPAGAKSKEIQRAVQKAKQIKGTPYKNKKGILSQALGTIGGIGPSSKACKLGPKGSHTCTSAIAAVYPNQFKSEYVTPNEMRNTKGMTLLGRYGKNPLRPGEVIANRVVAPLLRNAKWGLGAAGLAYGANKLHGYLKNKDQVTPQGENS